MSQADINDKQDTIEQLKNPNPIIGNKTWLRHKADGESGLIDVMILKGNYTLNQMVTELSENPKLKSKSVSQWEKRIQDHILHLSTVEGDSRNKASGMGGHNLNIEVDSTGKIIFKP